MLLFTVVYQYIPVADLPYNLYIHIHVANYLCIAIAHRRRKGWGYGAAAPPDFKSTP